jgi:hypothetical protein
MRGVEMLQGAILFLRGALRLPVRIVAWLAVLGGFNMLGPFFFFGQVEARIVLGTFFLSFGLMAMLTRRYGFTRILGLGHGLWLALVPYLALRAAVIPPSDAFGIWIRGVIIVNAMSLVFDVTDVVRYARGERAPLVPGL